MVVCAAYAVVFLYRGDVGTLRRDGAGAGDGPGPNITLILADNMGWGYMGLTASAATVGGFPGGGHNRGLNRRRHRGRKGRLRG